MEDPVAALVTFLRSDGAVADQVGTRVFAGELPGEENEHMPRLTVVLSPAGGGMLGRGYQLYGDKRVDVDCYGETARGSYQLHLDVYEALKYMTRNVSEGVLLHWARLSSDGRTTRHPQTDWPMTISSWQVLAGEGVAA